MTGDDKHGSLMNRDDAHAGLGLAAIASLAHLPESRVLVVHHALCKVDHLLHYGTEHARGRQIHCLVDCHRAAVRDKNCEAQAEDIGKTRQTKATATRAHFAVSS